MCGSSKSNEESSAIFLGRCPTGGYEAWSYVEPLLLMLEGGGRHVEDLREIQEDAALRRLVGLKKMPSVSTFGDWLVRAGAQGGTEAMRSVNEEVAGRMLARLAEPDYTLDVDATVIESAKKEAAWTYRKVTGYQPAGYCYHVIATNRDELAPDEVVWFHNRRGQAENLIKELKDGFGMEQMSSGDFNANSLWFAIGVPAYNLTQAQKFLFLDVDWRPRTIATLRWRLINVAGRLVPHGRRWILRLATSVEKHALFLDLRRRMTEMLLT